MNSRFDRDHPLKASALRSTLRIPLIAAPMFRASSVELVRSVCLAGVVGAFPSINARSPSLLETWITQIEQSLAEARQQGRTPAPYAINLLTHESNPRFEPDLEIIKRRRPPIVITSVGRPEVVVDAVHAYGGLVFSDVVSLHHAKRASSFQVDGMVLLCAGAGGQTGRLNPFAFIEAVRSFYDGLVIVAGGITRGRQLRAIEIAGADLGYCGTRFVASEESSAEMEHKLAVTRASIDDVWDTDAISGIPANTLRSSLERLGLTPETRWLQRRRENYDWSAVKEIPGVFSLGHGAGDVAEIEPATTIVNRLDKEYRSAAAAEG